MNHYKTSRKSNIIQNMILRNNYFRSDIEHSNLSRPTLSSSGLFKVIFWSKIRTRFRQKKKNRNWGRDYHTFSYVPSFNELFLACIRIALFVRCENDRQRASDIRVSHQSFRIPSRTLPESGGWLWFIIITHYNGN